MFPISDKNASINKPIVNKAIIIINIIVFLAGFIANHSPNFWMYWGLVPAKYTSSYYSHIGLFERIIPFFTSIFLHGGFGHIFANMWTLYIFGDNIEDCLGHKKYLLFYLLCGISAGLMHIIFNLNSNIPVIGASGAIAGVTGAYFILYPRAKIFVLLLFIPVKMPAYIFLGIWFAYQFIAASINSAGVGISSIAWWAHIGGFLAGIYLLKFFTGVSFTDFIKEIRNKTPQKKNNITVIDPLGTDGDPNLYGILDIDISDTAAEVRKTIIVRWGAVYSRTYKVTIPPRVSNGQILRLKGLGKSGANRTKGDLMLKIRLIRSNDRSG